MRQFDLRAKMVQDITILLQVDIVLMTISSLMESIDDGMETELANK